MEAFAYEYVFGIMYADESWHFFEGTTHATGFDEAVRRVTRIMRNEIKEARIKDADIISIIRSDTDELVGSE